MRLSVIIPAHNEAPNIGATVTELASVLRAHDVDHEILVVDDHSTDGTAAIVEALADSVAPTARCVSNEGPGGFGNAVRMGLEVFSGEAVAIVMADLSDDPLDVVKYLRLLEQGYGCAFGSRFMPGGSTHNYPAFKLLMNRLVNLGIRMLFRHGYNDTTNAFKAYRREVIESVQPLLSAHFNLTVELPLKAVVRGNSYAIVPISWRNRAAGESKLGLQEMGSRYLFIILYVFLEHHLSRGDYHRRGQRERARPRPWQREDEPGRPEQQRSAAS